MRARFFPCSTLFLSTEMIFAANARAVIGSLLKSEKSFLKFGVNLSPGFFIFSSAELFHLEELKSKTSGSRLFLVVFNCAGA